MKLVSRLREPSLVAASAILGWLELQALTAFGHSWVAIDTNATPGARGYQRLVSRQRMTGATNRGYSGKASESLAMNTLAGTGRWVPRTKNAVFAVCTINDLSLYGANLTSALFGFQCSWRAFLSMVTANAAVASNTTSFAYSAGWSAETVSGTSEITATGGARFTTTTVGAYFDTTFTGDAVDIVMVAKTTAGALLTFTDGGTTLGNLDLRPVVPQQTVAVFKVRGRGAGNHTVRCTVTSGTEATVDSYRIPATTPVPIAVLGEGTVLWPEAGREDYPNQLNNVFKPALAAIVAEYPTAAYVDLNTLGWDNTALSDDGRHPNDLGCAICADAATLAFSRLGYLRGLNVLSTAQESLYAAPAGPAIPAGGQDGTGTPGAGGGSTAPATPAAAPTLTAGNTQITAVGAAPGNGGSAITDYVWQTSTSSSTGPWTTFADGTSATPSTLITGLTNGTPIWVQYAAVNAIGQGGYSPAAGPITPAATGTSNVSDTFNRADAAALAGSTTETGSKTWARDTAGAIAGIVSSAVKVTSGTGNDFEVIDCGSADGTVTATLTAVSGSASTMISGMTLRETDAANNLVVQLRSGSTVRNYTLTSRTAGTATNVATASRLPIATDIVKVVMLGSSIKVYINAETTPIIDATTTVQQSATRHGLYFNGSDTVSTWDTWSYAP